MTCNQSRSYCNARYLLTNGFNQGFCFFARDPATLASYLEKYVMGVSDRSEYLTLHEGLTTRLAARDMFCAGVNYGY